MREDSNMRNGWKIKKDRYQKQNLKMQEEEEEMKIMKMIIKLWFLKASLFQEGPGGNLNLNCLPQ